jgi:DnaJ-class molecular chaperone
VTAGKFGKIAEAYEVLSDRSKRRMYDTSLSHEWDGGRPAQGGGGGGGGVGGGGSRGGAGGAVQAESSAPTALKAPGFNPRTYQSGENLVSKFGFSHSTCTAAARSRGGALHVGIKLTHNP